MSCVNCKHWQGVYHCQYGDCYRIIGQLEPLLLNCVRQDEYGADYYFTLPFDPHEIKYWIHHPAWFLLYMRACDSELPDGVRKVDEQRTDILYGPDGAQREGKITYHYFQTHRHFECPDWRPN